MKQNHFQNLPMRISKIKAKKVYAASAEGIRAELGYGLFAKKDIKKGEVLFIIKGKKIPLKIKNSKDSSLLPNAISLNKELWIDPKDNNPLVYLNHSCDPNSAIKGSVSIVALKPIKAHEHITIDYSITEWDKHWKLDKLCGCGAKNCRRVIRSIHFLPKQTYQSYMPYIPLFLQREYTNFVQ